MARGIPSGPKVKNLPANVGDTGSIPGLERSHMLGATKSVYHHYWACALELMSHNHWVHALQLRKPAHLEPGAPEQEKSPQ